MAKMYTHPHWETKVIDKSIYNPVQVETLPLHRPIFFCRAQKGPANVPVWCASQEDAYSTFGEGTFDMNTEYFSREALFMSYLFQRQGCFITRLVSDDAKKASFVLELRVRKTNIVQYQKNSAGQFVLDPTTGNRIPLIENGLPLTEPGLELKWQLRELNTTGNRKETISNLKPVTYGNGDNAYTVYPILAGIANTVGKYGDNLGIKFFVDLDSIDDVLATNLGCMPYQFGLVERTYSQDTVTAILSDFQDQYATVMLKPNQVDTRVARNVSFNEILDTEYTSQMPMELNLYSDNIQSIGQQVLEVETDDDTLFDPYMVNLADLYNLEGIPYSHVVMSEDDDAIYLNDTRILYLQGGQDGTIDDRSIESLTLNYLLTNSVYPELMEQPRYPFTHIYDTGVTIETKRGLIRFLGKHDAHKVILSTQDCVSIN